MYPASKWRITLRALDDDPRVAVLINRSVSRDTLSTLGFPSRRWTVVSSPSLLSRPWWNLPQNLVVVAVEKWKALCAFQAQRLFHGSIRLRSSALDDADSLCRWSGGKMSFTGFTDTYKQSRNVRLI